MWCKGRGYDVNNSRARLSGKTRLNEQEYDTVWMPKQGESLEETRHRQKAFANDKYARMGLNNVDIGDDTVESFFIKQS